MITNQRLSGRSRWPLVVLRAFAAPVLMLLLAAGSARAQTGSTAQLRVIVRGESGDVLPGAQVTVTQTNTGFKPKPFEDVANGAYTLANLPVGRYHLTVTLQGFISSAQDIELSVNSSPMIPVTLKRIDKEKPTVEETVTVQGTALVNSQTPGVGRTLHHQVLMDLPTGDGRNPVTLLSLFPASVPQPQLDATSRSMQGGRAFGIGGQLPFANAYALDGASHSNWYDNLNLPFPFLEALEEIRVETSVPTAQNGIHSGGFVFGVTRSGTNQFRGDVFGFLRHHNLNARDPFAAKTADGARQDDGLKRTQYGAVVGGPIVTDKVFFFAGYQGTNTRVNPTGNRAFVPTPAMLAGDFTAVTSPACSAGGQRTLRPPFAGNMVDPALFSPAALNIASRLPTTTDPCGLVQYGLPAATDDLQFVGKLDVRLNATHAMFGRYIATQVTAATPFSLDSAGRNLLTTRVGGRDNLAQTVAFGHNWVASASALNSFRFAFNRTSIARTSTDFFSAPDVGINLYSYLPSYMLLMVGNGTTSAPPPDGFQLGSGPETPSTFNTNVWQLSNDWTRFHGNHQFRVGGSAVYYGSLSLGNVRSPGQLMVDGTQTGLPIADFLLGRLGTNGLVQAAPNTLHLERTYLGVYAQDTWSLGRHFTFDYGLRYEPFFPPQFVNGAVYQFDETRFQQNVKSTVFPNAPAGLYFPGDPGFPGKAGMPVQWLNFAPRVGLAWDPARDGRTVFKAAYGKAYDFVNAQYYFDTSVAPPWGSEVRINSPSGGLDNPFEGSGQSNIFPVTFDQNASFSLNGPFISLSDDMKSTYVHQWNVTAERQFGDWLVSSAYVGSRANNIWETAPLNNALFVPVNGAAPSIANTNARRPLMLADPVNGKYYGPMDRIVTDGTQRADAMILSLQFASSGRMLTANYALSHCYGSPEGLGGSVNAISSGYNIPSDPGYDDGNCTADRLHNFTATAGIQSPDSWGPFASNWRLTGTFRAISGPWLTITVGTDRALNGQVRTQRVNQVLDDPLADQSVTPVGGGLPYLNPFAFEPPAVGTLGTIQRNSIRGMGSRTMDLVLARRLRVTGTQSVELRLEAFNVFNWVQWGQPATVLNAGTFGQITSVVPGSPRVLQLGLKYAF